MHLIYVAHPLGADPVKRLENIANAKIWFKWCVTHFEAAFTADWILYAESLSETDENRTYGIAADSEIAKCCDEIWLVGGRVSAGMAHERQIVEDAGGMIIDLTCLGALPPVLDRPLKLCLPAALAETIPNLPPMRNSAKQQMVFAAMRGDVRAVE